jgi:competence protein ComEC
LNLPTWFWIAGTGLCLIVWLVTKVLPKSTVLKHQLIHWTRADRRLPGMILTALFFIGGWRYISVQPVMTPSQAAYYNDRGTVKLVSTVVKPPDPRDTHTKLTIEVQTLKPLFDDVNTALQVSGKVLLQVQPWQGFVYGDQLEVIGELQTPFEAADFSYRDYLARQGILSTMAYAKVELIASGQGNPIKRAIYDLQYKAYDTLQNLFPSPESDLLAGILLGRDQGISPNLQDAFSRTGTTHIIAISGFNMAIVAGLFSGIFTRIIGRKWGALLAILSIMFYTILVGGGAAVVRAAIMGGLGVLGGMFGRRQNGLNSLGLASLGITLVNPNVLWDIGFQLSFAATLGLILYAQPLEERIIRWASQSMPEERAAKIVGPVSEFFFFSLIAQVMTLPIIAYHFRDISWIALIANPLILPPQPLVMILGGLALIAGLVLFPVGKLVSLFALPFVTYTIRMVEWLARLPGSRLVLPEFHFLWLLIFYVLLFLFTLVPKPQQASLAKRIFSYQTGLIVLAGLTIFVWHQVLATPDDKLHLTLLDGEGTLLIEAPGGRAVLVGGGESPSSLKQVLGEMLPAGGHQLDAVIVGSAARDDLNGLTGGLKNPPAQMVLWCCDPDINQTSEVVYRGFAEQGVPIERMQPGQRLDLGDGVVLEVVWVGERGALLWLEWEDFSVLIPAGKVDDQWKMQGVAPDVLILKDGVAVEDFALDKLGLWSPAVILFPLEKEDLTLHGKHAVLNLLADYPVVSTLDHDWVRITTDGKQLWVHGE